MDIFQVYFLISGYEQKQPPEVLRKVQHFQFRKFYRNTSVLESLFNNVAGFQACNVIKKGLEHRYFLVNFVKSLKAPILKNICEQLLLKWSNFLRWFTNFL